jgi:hypothetical protein
MPLLALDVPRLFLAARYRLGDDPWAITPLVRYINPSHDYNYQAEAVVGFDRREFAVGVDASLRLVGLLPKASIEAGYTYSYTHDGQAYTVGATWYFGGAK